MSVNGQARGTNLYVRIRTCCGILLLTDKNKISETEGELKAIQRLPVKGIDREP